MNSELPENIQRSQIRFGVRAEKRRKTHDLKDGEPLIGVALLFSDHMTVRIIEVKGL